MRLLALLFLAACAHNAPSTNAPKFYWCNKLNEDYKLCVRLYECNFNPSQKNKWGEWVCKEVPGSE